MNLKSLEAFVWAARLGSFSRAAEQQNSTLATFSARISSLENELGVSLFDRLGRGVQLSLKGREALPYAESVLMAASRFEARIKDSAAYQGHVKLGLIDTAASAILPQLLKTLNRQYPNVDFDLVSGTSASLADDLRRGVLDLAILIADVAIEGARERALFGMPLRWVASPHLVGDRTHLSVEEFAGFPILSFAAGSAPHRHLLELLVGTRKRQSIYCGTSMSTMIRLAEDGFGITALPLVLLQSQLSSGRLQVLDIGQDLPGLKVKISYMESTGTPLLEAIAESALAVARSFRETYSPELIDSATGDAQ
ncbi:MAG: LysR family transcriptional regulator [Rhodobacter sp.]|nr:LysR family transcriptional regulator [Rhodobacter sp.]